MLLMLSPLGLRTSPLERLNSSLGFWKPSSSMVNFPCRGGGGGGPIAGRLLVLISKLRTDAGLPSLILRALPRAGGGVGGGRLTLEGDTKGLCCGSLVDLLTLPTFLVGGGGGGFPLFEVGRPSSATAMLFRRLAANSAIPNFTSSSSLGDNLPGSLLYFDSVTR